MALPKELVSQFVKSTKDETSKKNESIVYGTIQATTDENGDVKSAYVKIDGSDELIPISNTIKTIKDENGSEKEVVTAGSSNTILHNKDRVTVMIKNHQAVVTGNLTNPNATVQKVRYEVENLNAEYAKITYVDSEIAHIEELYATKANVDTLLAKKASITELDVERGRISTLESNYGKFNDLIAKKASIAELDVERGRIVDLESGVARIDTLMFGSASGSTIQTSFANAVIAQLGAAQIKSAMIDSISADKITAGTIKSNEVKIVSDDDTLHIADGTIQIKDEDENVRVQLGKDGDSNYSIAIYDENGEVIFTEGGFQQPIIRNDMVSDTAAIDAHKLDIDSLFEVINTDGSNTIKSTKVYLDDESQTLDLAFESLTTKVTDQDKIISSQGTAISTIQGKISSKVWQQDIDTAKNELSTKHSTLQQEVNAFKTTVGETYATIEDVDTISIGGRNLMTNSEDGYEFTGSSFNNSTHSGTKITCTVDGGKADHYCMVTDRITPTPNDLSKEIGTELTFSADVKIVGSIVNPHMLFDLRSDDNATRIAIIRAYADPSITDRWQRISGTAAITSADCDITRALIAMLYNSATLGSTIEYRRVKVERGNKSTDWTPAPEDVESNINDLNDRVYAAETTIIQNTEAITARATKTEVSTAKAEAVSEASADATAKANNALNNANANTANLLKNYSTTAEMNSAIQLSASGITSSVSTTYATKQSLNDLSIGGRNYASLKNMKRYAGGSLYDILMYYTIDGSRITAANQPTSGPVPGFKIYTYGSYKYAVSGRTGLSTVSIYYKCFDADGNEVQAQHTLTTTSTNNLFEKFFEVPSTTAYFTIGVGSTSKSEYYLENLQIERGNRVTDWTPAPEDIEVDIIDLDSRITSAESSITQLSNKITANVTETTNLGTRMTTVEQTSTRLTTRITTAETDILNAGRTATNFMELSTSGLIIGDMTANTLGENVLVRSGGVDVREGEDVFASFTKNKIILGQNSADSIIDLCNGAGTIRALISEASTSYPEYDSIGIESQEIKMSCQTFEILTESKDSSSAAYTNTSYVDLYSPSSDAGSFASMSSTCETNSSGDYFKTGFSTFAYDTESSTRAMIYAWKWDESENSHPQSTANQVNVYPTYTSMSKPLKIQGTEFTGENKVLWSGTYYMSAAQTATLSEAISDQANGIVLIWSEYTDGASVNANFNMFFIPKYFVGAHVGKGVGMFLTSATLNVAASKYVYVSNTSITGYSTNDDGGTVMDSGITSTPKKFVLRYVIGV